MSGLRQRIPRPRRAERTRLTGPQAGGGAGSLDASRATRSLPERAKLRRRLRYLRALREVQLRDLGGLLLDLYKFRETRNDLVVARLSQARQTDTELRRIEAALGEGRALRDLREPGIGGLCPTCHSYYGTDATFCAHCGVQVGEA